MDSEAENADTQIPETEFSDPDLAGEILAPGAGFVAVSESGSGVTAAGEAALSVADR